MGCSNAAFRQQFSENPAFCGNSRKQRGDESQNIYMSNIHIVRPLAC